MTKMNVDLKKVGLFVGGFATAVAGLPIVTSKDAKKVYTHGLAAVLRAKECVMTKITEARECAGDILADAEQLNQEREEVEVVIEDASIEVEA